MPLLQFSMKKKRRKKSYLQIYKGKKHSKPQKQTNKQNNNNKNENKNKFTHKYTHKIHQQTNKPPNKQIATRTKILRCDAHKQKPKRGKKKKKKRRKERTIKSIQVVTNTRVVFLYTVDHSLIENILYPRNKGVALYCNSRLLSTRKASDSGVVIPSHDQGHTGY